MKTICLYFEIHQNIHLKRYRFFDIGTDHYYYDDFENEHAITETAAKSYIPALQTLLEMARTHAGYFKFAISLSGVAVEQLENHAPDVIELLQELNETGCVEFLAEPYSHGLSSLTDAEAFKADVQKQCRLMKEMFGKTPEVIRNSSLIYCDDIGEQVAAMGFKGMITEGARHILGWKSPHYLYHSLPDPNLKLLLRDYKLSDDIALRFSDANWSEHPLFAETYVDWIASTPESEQVINIFMELCALGMFQPLSSHILDFLKAIPQQAKERGIAFATPSEIVATHSSVDALEVPYPMSWTDEERNISFCLGNVMQREAFEKLYSVAEKVRMCNDRRIKQDWDYLQASNNFRFMSTKPESYGMYRGIYDSPYDAFTNYMNILADFMNRVNSLFPNGVDNEELNALLTTIRNQGEELQVKDKEISRLNIRLKKKEDAMVFESQTEPKSRKRSTAASKKTK